MHRRVSFRRDVCLRIRASSGEARLSCLRREVAGLAFRDYRIDAASHSVEGILEIADGLAVGVFRVAGAFDVQRPEIRLKGAHCVLVRGGGWDWPHA